MVALAGTAFAGSLPAAGAGPTTPGAECLAITSPLERLACFDRSIGSAVGGTEPGQPAPEASPAEPTVAESTASPPVPAPSMIDAVWGFLPSSRGSYVRLHEPNYLLLGRYTNNVNREPYEPLFDAFGDDDYDFEKVEAKFQLSFKGRLLTTDDRRWGLWFAYTQQSQWQVYATDISSPFRETNYMPELIGSFRPGVEFGGWHWNLLNAGFTHQSNGRADPISRSWDRLFVEAGIEKGNLVLTGRAWAVVADGEDNPDITDYYGHTEFNAFYRWRENSFNLMARGNLDTGKGAAQFTWATRPVLGPLRGYFQVFTGYGESMIDYNWRQTTVGLGITLNDRF